MVIDVGLLDQLLEKKDVLAYINYRIQYLEATFDVMDYPASEREGQRQRHIGRERELKLLQRNVANNALKRMSKIYCGWVNAEE